MRKINKIIIHCSASDDPYQDFIWAVKALHILKKDIKIKWGKYNTYGRGWSDIGYHGFVDSYGKFTEGRPVAIQGAHCYGENSDSIGYCLSGVKPRPAAIKALVVKVKEDLKTYGLKPEDVKGHFEFNTNKSCPNINMENFRRSLQVTILENVWIFFSKITIFPKKKKQISSSQLNSYLMKLFSKSPQTANFSDIYQALRSDPEFEEILKDAYNNYNATK